MIGKVVTGCVAILSYHTATQDRGSECRDFGFISRIVTALVCIQYIYIYIYIYALVVERLSAWPIIGADIKHFYDYRYRPFSKQAIFNLPIIIIIIFFYILCKQTYYLQVTLFIGE